MIILFFILSNSSWIEFACFLINADQLPQEHLQWWPTVNVKE